jgi:beta-aspartyl-peptidase (threonine type)
VRGRVIVHGGVDSPGGPQVLRALEDAARAGRESLGAGRDALAAAEAAIWVLEADPLFNAGLGSVLNKDGEVETDASIADGTNGRFAGVAALPGVIYPISVAAELLRRAPGPVLLAAAGAKRFAREIGAPERDLRTAEQLRIWEEVRKGEAPVRSPFTGRRIAVSETVGAIVLDGEGRLAAGSSTGGTLLKMAGRVGDAAIFGAGIYADGPFAALCSGLGEAAIELSLALRVVERYRQQRDPQAAVETVELLNQRRAVGGIVLFDAEEDLVAVAHNAANFPVVTEIGAGPELVPAVRLEEVSDG